MRIFALALFALAACGGGGTSTQPTTPTTPTTPTNTTPVAETPPPVVENDASICTSRESEFGPMQLDAAQAARRRGRDTVKFSAANTTKEKPIEVCGVGKQQEWLMRAACDDGSRPFEDRSQIAQSRRGNVGPGGTCGAIIDLYAATCPEKTYEIHVDMYHCGPNESMR